MLLEKELIIEANKTISNLLMLADFNEMNHSARAYNILKPTLDEYINLANYFVLNKKTTEELHLFHLIALKKAIKHSKQYLKKIIIDVSLIEENYLDHKKIYNIVKTIKNKFKYKKTKLINENSKIFIYFDEVKSNISFDTNLKEPFIRHSEMFKINFDITLFVNELSKKINDADIHYYPKIISSLKFYENKTIIELYMESKKEILMASTDIKDFNKDIVFKLIIRDIYERNLFKGESLDSIYQNFNSMLELKNITKY